MNRVRPAAAPTSSLLGSAAMPVKTPRLAGRSLQALARLLAAPVAGRRVADSLMRAIVLDRLRRRDLSDAEARPVVVFRPAPRRPDVVTDDRSVAGSTLPAVLDGGGEDA
jgi:hypothetical protein